MPGSPFLDYSSALFSANSSTAASNSSSALTQDKTSQNKTQKVPSLLDEDESTLEFCSTYDYTSVGVFISSIILNRFVEFDVEEKEFGNLSKIWITSRFGLWISDLSVTQIMQEKVPEAHRGKINGVQNGMQELMNVIKYVLVMVLPRCDH